MVLQRSACASALPAVTVSAADFPPRNAQYRAGWLRLPTSTAVNFAALNPFDGGTNSHPGYRPLASTGLRRCAENSQRSSRDGQGRGKSGNFVNPLPPPGTCSRPQPRRRCADGQAASDLTGRSWPGSVGPSGASVPTLNDSRPVGSTSQRGTVFPFPCRCSHDPTILPYSRGRSSRRRSGAAGLARHGS